MLDIANCSELVYSIFIIFISNIIKYLQISKNLQIIKAHQSELQFQIIPFFKSL